VHVSPIAQIYIFAAFVSIALNYNPYACGLNFKIQRLIGFKGRRPAFLSIVDGISC
jgi:hypothetical protein